MGWFLIGLILGLATCDLCEWGRVGTEHQNTVTGWASAFSSVAVFTAALMLAWVNLMVLPGLVLGMFYALPVVRWAVARLIVGVP